MLWQTAKVAPRQAGSKAIVEAVATQPVDRSLAIRRILYEMRGADAGDGEQALEQAERQLTALLVHDAA